MLSSSLDRFYRKFISLKAILLFLGILIFFCLLGTIFPQGKEYAPGEGTLLSIMKFFDLLNIFSSPLFLLVSILFLLHIGLCNFDRLKRLWSKRSAADTEMVKDHLAAQSKKILLPAGSSTHMDSMNNIFKLLGFRALKQGQEGGMSIMEKGLSPQWISLIYHIALFICLIGFFITFLFAFEGDITLHPDKQAKIPDPSFKPRWDSLWASLGFDPGQGINKKIKGLALELEKFSTEYTQVAKLDYPKDFLSRIALVFGLPGSKPIYSADSKLSYYPKDWKSRLILYNDGKQVKEKIIEVNHPLHYQGLTFYQMAFLQELKLVVETGPAMKAKETVISVKSGEKFRLPPLSGYFKTGTLRVGTLYKKDGTKEEIVPLADLYYLDEDATENPIKINTLILKRPSFYQGISITLEDYSEASILSFRCDPGRPWLWVASVSLLLFMTLRIWGGWFRVIYWLEREGEACNLHYVYRGIGLGADETRFLARLKHFLDNQLV